MHSQTNKSTPQYATIGGGCFWCLDAIYRKIKGITAVKSGFCGGDEVNPSYQLACSGQTEHIEVVHITFDPEQLSFENLLMIFFASHDPSQANGQGNDIGPQYRSVIFYHDHQQQQIAKQMIETLNHSAIVERPIVTLVRPAKPFYPADPEHQNYYQRQSETPYCQFVIKPKLNKIIKLFATQIQP